MWAQSASESCVLPFTSVSDDSDTAISDKLQHLGITEENVHVQRKRCVNPSKLIVMVKVYGQEPADLLLGTMAEFVGFLDTDACSQDSNDGGIDEMLPRELAAFDGLPVLHCVLYSIIDPLAHPLLQDAVLMRSVQRKSAHQMVIDYLQPCVRNDRLAAQFLLVHMVSKIRVRYSATPIGAMPLNLANMTPTAAANLTESMCKLLQRVCVVPLALSELDSQRMAPGVFVSSAVWRAGNSGKDTEVCGLVGGVLQLPGRSWVVFDMCRLETGNLGEQGVVNVRHISDLISFGELPYALGEGSDSPTHSPGKIPVDIGVLVVSTTKSLFDINCVVCVNSLEENATTRANSSEQQLNIMRAYLGSVISETQYDIPDEMNEVLTQNFVEKRKSTSTKGCGYTQEAFLQRMEIARLLCALEGEPVLTSKLWAQSGEMEEMRELRAENRLKQSGADGGVVGR
ncbi:hypothetical protein HDU82_008866 [Entophlyctis luteolus]|nr:hypothetical protein HDU82_008866 [Entophlyctis luteolus]